MRRSDESRRQSGPNTSAGVDPQWAWAPYEPDEQGPWTPALVGHLWRRAAFGVNWSELRQALHDGPQETVSRMMQGGSGQAAQDADYDAIEASVTNGDSLRAWWLRRMIESRHPLREKMTLFWRSHFGLSVGPVGDAQLLASHIRLLRRHALGSYRQMLYEVTRDPAVYLGWHAQASRKAAPNVNFARQLLEQLTMGPGSFDEQDLTEAARALTGWFVLRGQLRFFQREHDAGPKTVLGRRGAWQRDDVLAIALEQPATPLRLATKLYRWFVSEEDQPREELLRPLADMLAGEYDVGQVVERILRSNLFFSPVAYRQRVKSPVEFAIGIVHALEGLVSTTHLAGHLARIGQDLHRPPTAYGWPGGRHWLNPAVMIGRTNLAAQLLSTKEPYDGKLNPADVAAENDAPQGPKRREWFVDLLLQGDVSSQLRAWLDATFPDGPQNDQATRELVQWIVMTPEYQLS